MGRIVLTTIGSLGDLHPLIAIGLRLRERGHSVVFATIQDYRSLIESLGFEFYKLRPDYIAMDDPEMIARMMNIHKGTEHVVRDYLLANLRDTYIDLIGRRRTPDYFYTWLCCSLFFWGFLSRKH
ncbi:glycosyltransferase [Aetokthonos hydrillicola Thurmond2011]|jgi:UDP:flavonoid glycosyltransferase YjiC (YdhE family)|uniref:Glycosyltransferase n=1 Tax=Aetokthonos hydrillicola Thurmond2011 TaxID=2712845 RepID=A0AAP5I3D1_9CYAN|nr:glycosyltransferase [Aetokthonos hydrillicola]MDR9893049.1 glycosyltransferase [Aetokthonos hydrillicola Thurmond2011]